MQHTTHQIGFDISVLAQGPGAADVELVMAGFFNYEKDEPELMGGAKQLNDGLHGLAMQKRTDGTFNGDLGETHLFKSPDSTIPARNVMLVGLGSKKEFDLPHMEKVGYIVFNAANENEFSDVAFAPEIKDAGVTCFDAGHVIKTLVTGMMRAFKELKDQGKTIHIKKFQPLAGKAHEARVGEILAEAVKEYQ